MRKKKTKVKIEFSKFILALYAFACIGWIEQNYLLAFLNRTEINAEVTITIITSLAVAILGYYSKSFGEKNSLNKHKLSKKDIELNE